jgi:hypothetical protein
LRNSIVQDGDIQVIIPYALHREALLWIRRTHRSLTVDEFVAQAVDARLRTVVANARTPPRHRRTDSHSSQRTRGSREPKTT